MTLCAHAFNSYTRHTQTVNNFLKIIVALLPAVCMIYTQRGEHRINIESKTTKKTMKATECYAQMNSLTMIDVVNPDTNTSQCYGHTLRQICERYPGAEQMSIEEFCRRKAAAQDTPIEWIPTDRSRYWEMLEVLPPAVMCGSAFLVGEPMDHHAVTGQPRFMGFRQIGSAYLASNRPITIQEFRRFLPPQAAV